MKTVEKNLCLNYNVVISVFHPHSTQCEVRMEWWEWTLPPIILAIDEFPEN